MTIIEDDLTSPAVEALLREHLDAMVEHSPPGEVYALPIAELRAPEVAFFTAWEGRDLLGCGALQEIEPEHGEIKSMRTARDHLGRGVGSAILEHLIAQARRRSYRRLSLETGSGEAFAAALSLYEKFGFEYCGPFASYRENGFSKFMTLALAAEPA